VDNWQLSMKISRLMRIVCC